MLDHSGRRGPHRRRGEQETVVDSRIDLAIGVLAALAIILVATGVCGRLAQAVGQPRVVGEMVAGVVLGPSIFGAVLPSVQQDLFTPDIKNVLYVLSTIGLTFYMFLVGAGIDHQFLNRRSIRRAATVASSGIVVPLVLGAGTGLLLADRLAGQGTSTAGFALFLGAALAVTAFPVLARILQERRMTSTPLGSMTLVAAAIDDAAAWALLAVVVALGAAGSTSGVLIAILGAALFAVGMFTLGRRLLRLLVRRVERAGTMTHGSVVVVLLIVVACGWFTDTIGIHSVFGGFIAGVALPASPVLRRELTTRLADVNAVLLMPVFFVFSGLNTELAGLLDISLLLPLALLMLVAFVGKYVGCALVVRLHGFSWRHASAVGALMNARGVMILIFINVGLGQGVIGPPLFTMLVLVAVVTTAAATPIYRASFPVSLEDAERGADDRSSVDAADPRPIPTAGTVRTTTLTERKEPA
ncbi:MAG: hypothetical protein GEV10_15365 [Streptosporangiales bacterium]|nr:hypothetical protein [Streptosporangiales bacterium]